MFRDMVYEEMDHLTKLVEEYDDILSDKLAAIPVSIEIHSLPIRCISSTHISIEKILQHGNVVACEFSPHESNFVVKECIFSVEPESSQDNNAMLKDNYVIFDKPIVLTKSQHRLKNEQILRFAASNIVDLPEKAKLADLNELIHLLIPNTANSDLLKTSSSTKKRLGIKKYVVDHIIRDNTWNIRNTALFGKLNSWAYGAALGNLACKANLARLACMRHNGHGIYSMEEVV